MRVTLVAAGLLVVHASASARAAQFTPQYGGAVLETWVSNHPTDPSAFIVWTAEPGPRIRRIVPDPSQPGEHIYSFDTINRPDANAPNEALHHIWVADDLSFGVAVGSGGIVLVAEDLGNNVVWKEQPSPAGSAHAWESIWSQDGRRGFLAAENGLYEWLNPWHDAQPWPQGEVSPIWWWQQVTNLPSSMGFDREYLSLGGEFFQGASPLAFRGAVGVRHVDAGPAASARSIYYLDESVPAATWQEACLNPSSCSTPPLDLSCSWDLHLWDIDFDATTGTGFAVGGQRLGNSLGYAFRSTDWGQTWKQSFSEYSQPFCALDLCTGESTCPSPSSFSSDKQDPVCGTAQPGEDSWPFGAWLFSTFYGVTALPDGRAVAVSYGSGIWTFDPAFASDGAWSLVSDSRFFGTGPLWGVHHAETSPESGEGEIWVSGLFSDIRHAAFSESEDGDSTISLACTWKQLAIGGGDLRGDRCPSSPWPSWYPTGDPPAGEDTAYPVWRLQDISFGSSEVGYVVGQEGRIAKTTDGGASWSEQRMEGDLAILSAGPVTLGKVLAIGEDSVVAVSNDRYGSRTGPTVFYTVNGGEPPSGSVCADAVTGEGWNRVEDSDMPQASLATTKIRDLTSNGSVFWALADDDMGGNFKLWASTDGGKTWVKYNPSGDLAGFQAKGLAFSDATTAYVVGSRSGAGVAYKVEPGPSGRVATELINPDCGLPNLIDVDAYAHTAGTDVVYAVGNDGCVVSVSPSPTACPPTILGSIVSLTPENLLRVAITADATENLTVFATGLRGVVLRGEHGQPSSWMILQSRSTDKLTGACFLTPNLGWITGQNRSGEPSTPDQWADASILKYEDL